MKKLFAVLLAIICASCATTKEVNNGCAGILKMSLEELAGSSAADLFSMTFKPEDSKLVKVEEVNKILNEINFPVKKLPEQVQKSLQSPNTMALVISRMYPLGDKTSKMADETTRILLLWESSLINGDAPGFWIDPGAVDRCPDGGRFNKCCRGHEGRYAAISPECEICLCTLSCRRTCPRKCPKCRHNPFLSEDVDIERIDQ
jgi:hypothetical protein